MFLRTLGACGPDWRPLAAPVNTLRQWQPGAGDSEIVQGNPWRDEKTGGARNERRPVLSVRAEVPLVARAASSLEQGPYRSNSSFAPVMLRQFPDFSGLLDGQRTAAQTDRLLFAGPQTDAVSSFAFRTTDGGPPVHRRKA